MIRLGHVQQFVPDDVLDALDRLLGQFRVQPDAAAVGIAAAALRPNPLLRLLLDLAEAGRGPAQGSNCGIARRMKSSNSGTVKAISPWDGL